MPQLLDTWRFEAELFCGTETFRNHQDVKWIGSGTAAPPMPSDAIYTAFQEWLLANYYPDVTLNTVFLREIWYKQGPPPHPEHPPVWTESVGLAGLANTTYGGAHNANYLPQEVCIFCKKTTSGGRSGKMFMRNILTEVDVQSTIGGVWAFSPGAGHFDPTVFNNTSNTLLGDFETLSGPTGNWVLAVTHLEGIPDTDTRTPFSTAQATLAAIRPTWNKSTR
jgi:hypothetical protein